MTKRIIQDNFHVNLQSTKKFKSTRIHISFGSDLTIEHVTKRALLPYLLRAVSTKFDTRAKMSSYLDNLYAAQFGVGSSKVGLSHFISFDLSVINDKYTIDNESLFEEGILFLKEIITNPLFKEDVFLDEKRLLSEYFLSVYANKMRVAIKHLQTEMFKEELYQVSALGIEEQVADITLKDVIDEYHHMITHDKITISVVGDINEQDVLAIINKHFTFKNRNKELELFESNPNTIIEPKEHILTQDVTQAKLAMGFRCDIRYLDSDYYAAIVFNNVFGGSSDSILHQRIREELGLVYFVSSSYDFYKGVLFVFAGINEEEYSRTTSEVEQILNTIIDGTLDKQYLDIAKKTIINNMIESRDSNYNLVIRLERKDLFDRDISLEESIENIKKVTFKQVQEVAKKIVLDTTVLLRGENNE